MANSNCDRCAGKPLLSRLNTLCSMAKLTPLYRNVWSLTSSNCSRPLGQSQILDAVRLSCLLCSFFLTMLRSKASVRLNTTWSDSLLLMLNSPRHLPLHWFSWTRPNKHTTWSRQRQKLEIPSSGDQSSLCVQAS